MAKSGLGKEYCAGEVIVRQGETGDSMYVIQSGRAEVIQSKDGQEMRLAVLGKGDIFGVNQGPWYRSLDFSRDRHLQIILVMDVEPSAVA